MLSTYHAPSNEWKASHSIQQQCKCDWMNHISTSHEPVEWLLLQVTHIIWLTTLQKNK